MNRLPIIATAAAGLLIAALPPAVAAAAPTAAAGCAQWEFNGQTGVNLGSSGGWIQSITFSATGPAIQNPVSASYMEVSTSGSPSQPVEPILGTVTGGIGSGGQIDLAFTPDSDTEDGPTWQMDGHVNADGIAQGDYWNIGSPLKCMSTTTAGTPTA